MKSIKIGDTIIRILIFFVALLIFSIGMGMEYGLASFFINFGGIIIFMLAITYVTDTTRPKDTST